MTKKYFSLFKKLHFKNVLSKILRIHSIKLNFFFIKKNVCHQLYTAQSDKKMCLKSFTQPSMSTCISIIEKCFSIAFNGIQTELWTQPSPPKSYFNHWKKNHFKNSMHFKHEPYHMKKCNPVIQQPSLSERIFIIYINAWH